MEKSTKNVIIGIGAIGILFGVYSIFGDGELYNNMWGIIIGISLIGSVYFDKNLTSDT